jgi:hypothetical protein
MRTAEQNRRVEVAYYAAYTLVPRYASDRDQLVGDFAEAPDLTAIRWYIEAAKMLGRVADRDDVAQLRGHTGRLDADRDYYLIEYPRFPAVDLLASLDAGGLPAGTGAYVLAPYFSAALLDREAREMRYFVLGQSPDARTMVREVTPEMDANLGSGCAAEREALLSFLRQRLAPQ